MSVTNIVSEAARLGIILRTDGRAIQYRPVGRMTGELRDLIRQNKGAIIAFIRSAAPEAEGEAGCRVGPRLSEADKAAIAFNRKTVEVSVAWPTIPPGTPRAVADLCGPRKGWAPDAWRQRLQQMMRASESANPEQARKLRKAAALFRESQSTAFDNYSVCRILNNEVAT